MSPEIVVVGGANTDYLVRGLQLPQPGETVAGETFQEAPGGKGANQAVAAARLGANALLVARVGPDERGERILEALQAEGIDTRFVVRDKEASTGVALIMVEKEGEKQIMTAPGANMRLASDDVRAAVDVIGAAKVVMIASEIPEDTLLVTARLAYESGAKVVLDPARPATLSDAIFPLIHAIKPNASEARAVTGIRVESCDTARRAAHWLLERGVEAAAVQAGDDGNLLVWSGGERWLPKLPVKSIDATGAGDALAAALAVMIAEGRSWDEAGPFANAAAALTTTVIGAQAALPTREAVEALLTVSP